MLESETCAEIMQIDGNARGAVFQTDAKYIIQHYGHEKFDQLKSMLQQLGHPIDYENIQAMEWYPLNRRVLAFKVMEDLFSWQTEDFIKMGNAAPKYSFIVKLLMKFFISPRTGLHHAPQYWTRHYDIGSLEVAEFNEQAQHAIIQVYDFKIMPIYCRYLEGYFARLFTFTLPKKTIKIVETKCMHRGDDHHEYKVTWATEGD